MTATHILFVAWQKADEKKAEAKAWANFKNKSNKNKSEDDTRSRYKVVVYKPKVTSQNLSKMQTGQIYILGHGAAGYGNIADIDGTGGVELNAQQVAERLIESGLKPAFSGKIKCYNCHSATSQNGKPAFAALFAEEMRKRQYEHCQYFGYDSSISAAYTDSGLGGTHKHALLKQDLDLERYLPIARAKEKREKMP